MIGLSLEHEDRKGPTIQMLRLARVEGLHYVGQLNAESYRDAFRQSTGLTDGRMHSVLQMVAKVGLPRIRHASDDELRRMFEPGGPYIEPVLRSTDSMGGLTHTSILAEAFNREGFYAHSTRGNLGLTVNGVRVLRNIAANFDDKPSFELADIKKELAELKEKLSLLQTLIPGNASITAGIGHNMPPAGERIGLSSFDVDDTRAKIDDVQSELNKPNALHEANPIVVESARIAFAQIANKITEAVKTGGGAFAKGALGEMGKAAWNSRSALAEKFVSVSNALAHWLTQLM
jgi:hypothetical protein